MKTKAKIYQLILCTGVLALIMLTILAIGENKNVVRLNKIFSKDEMSAAGITIEYDLSETEEDNVTGVLDIETGELVISGTGRMKGFDRIFLLQRI